MTRLATISLIFGLTVFVHGCSMWDRVEVQVEGEQAFEQHRNLKSAVLDVNIPEGETWSVDTRIWGTVYPNHRERSFAELLAHFGNTTGKMQIIPPSKVSEILRENDLDPDLDPDPEHLTHFLDTLGCEAYLKADVEHWNYSYFLLRQRARIAFRVSLHVPEKEEPLWTANVAYSAGGKTDREVATTALQKLFERLNEGE